MKTRIILLICISVLITACSPQVTVTPQATVTLTPPPTATPIPTPTLHPQFIALQDQITASGEGFALLPDGTVQDGGVSVPGLQVDPKGVMTIDVEGEKVVLDPSAVHLGPDGVQVDGYELDGNGEWEVAQLTPEQQLAVDLERWNMTGDKYNVEYDEEGKIELREKGTDRLVYWDGRWSAMDIIEMARLRTVSQQACETVIYEPGAVGANYPLKVYEEDFKVYRQGLVKEFQNLMGLDMSIKIRYKMEYLGLDNSGLHCWGISLETVFSDSPMDTNFAYRDDKHKLHVYPVFYSQDHK